MRFLGILLLLQIALLASDTKHIEMDYGDVMSMTVDSQWPETEKVTHKAIIQRLNSIALPAKGTPVGKGRFIKVRKDSIENTENDKVYQYQRERSSGYLIAVPSGEYKVTLQFAEIKRKSVGERVFDIYLQQKKIKSDFDALKETGGQFKAIDIVSENVKIEKFFRLDFVQKSTRSTPAIAGIIIEGKNFTKKINCGGKKEGDYEGDWDKNSYMDDPFVTGVTFDTELLRYSAAWENGFVELKGTAYDATHGSYPVIQGKQVWGSGYVPGWHFGKYSPEDKREDHLGHLPKEWAHYKGIYRHESGNVFTYSVGDSLIYDNMSLVKVPGTNITQAYARTVQAKLQSSAWQLIAEFPKGDKALNTNGGTVVDLGNGFLLTVNGIAKPKYKVLSRKVDDEEVESLYIEAASGEVHYATILYKVQEEDKTAKQRFTGAVDNFKLKDLKSLVNGGKSRWPGVIKTAGTSGENDNMLTIDEIVLPENNPWRSWMRPGAFDFFADGKSLAVSTWSGDVWVATNLDDIKNVKWKRFAAGLFHPLGLKIVDEKIYVQCRDQISILHDLNNDGEADYYQNFNNDVIITSNFHEFSFDLQRDKKGNFYFIKGAPVVAGGEGFGEIKKHHGCLFRVSPDGEKLEVIATGFRAPNGMGLSPDGQLTTSDNEGNWVAATPINWVKEGGFYGVVSTSHQAVTPKTRSNILCWIPHEVDNSAGGQVWVPKGEWGPLGGEMLHISYGQAKLFHVFKEEVDGLMQGGVIDLKPSGEFDAGIMRGRFNDKDKAVYLCGLKGWQTKGVKDGGLYRVRYTGQKSCRPVGLKAGQNGLTINFSEPVNELSALDAGNYELSRWVYEISNKYGSRHFKVPGTDWALSPEFSPVPEKDLIEFEKKKFKDAEEKETALKQLYSQYVGEDSLEIQSISLSDDKKTVFLEIPNISPVMQMHVAFEIESSLKKPVKADIYHTIHKLGKWKGKPGKKIDGSELKAPQPGMVVKYVHRGQKKEDVRVQRMASFYVGERTAITQFLDHGPFDAHLDGFIKVERNMKADIFVAGTGSSTISLNGQVITREKTDGQAISVVLKKGFNKLHIEYKGPDSGDASFRLYWESLAYFPKEPIPAVALYHEGGQEVVAESILKRHGLQVALDNNCFACHADKKNVLIPELIGNKMSLDAASSRLNPLWISQWLKNPNNLRSSAKMPQLLKSLPESQWEQAAADIATFLSPSVAKNAAAGNADAGKEIYNNLGCASCHSFKDDDLTKTMISLKNASFKFQQGGMAAFIEAPQKYSPQSRMPDFGLSPLESQHLEAYIRLQLKPSESTKANGDAARGKALYSQLNCNSCHTHKDVTLETTLIKLTSKTGGCLTGSGDGKPDFTLKSKDKKALEAFLKVADDSLKHFQPAEFAERQLKTLSCFNCHTRDGKASNWKSPHALPKDLPPSLTHVGEKIIGPYLNKIFSGETGKMRPWQKAKMPAFKSQAANLAMGLNQLHGFNNSADKIVGKEDVVGKSLIQQNQFACILCHDAGEVKALAPFGVPGLNLQLSSGRLRHEYYLRWMLNPQRVEPSTHMTRFSSDHKKTGIKAFEGDAQKQFDAIWDYMKKMNQK